jgi:hypothetical protein
MCSFARYGTYMTNYYPLMASVVAALAPNTAEARRQLYDSARVGFPTYLGNLDPPLSDSDITRERTALEEVIRRLEAEQMKSVISDQ